MFMKSFLLSFYNFKIVYWTNTPQGQVIAYLQQAWHLLQQIPLNSSAEWDYVTKLKSKNPNKLPPKKRDWSSSSRSLLLSMKLWDDKRVQFSCNFLFC